MEDKKKDFRKELTEEELVQVAGGASVNFCPLCNGKKSENGKTCPRCGGRGIIIVSSRS